MPRGHGPALLLTVLAVTLAAAAGKVFIQSGPQSHTAAAGHTVVFRCSAASEDVRVLIPTITWERNGESLHYRYLSSARLRQSDVDNSLTIDDVQLADAGVYTCIAQVEHQVARASAQLTVQDVPAPPYDVTLVLCRDRVAQIRWRHARTSHGPLTHFTVEYNTSWAPAQWRVARARVPPDRLYQRIALSPWANYTFRVLAVNDVGVSAAGAPTRRWCQTEPDVPHLNAQGVCTRNERPRQLVITWQSMEADEQNGPGFYFLVKWRRHDLSNDQFNERIVGADQTMITVSNCPIYMPYEVYVLAVNSVGEAVAPPQMVIGYSSEDVPHEAPKQFGLDPEKKVTQTTADFRWQAVNTGPWAMQGFFKGYKIQFWKTDTGMSSMREHSIIYREPGPCWRQEHRHRRRHHHTGSRGRHTRSADQWGPDTERLERPKMASSHIYNLWPFTNITAHIRVLNAKYEGPPSRPITFQTAEGVPSVVRSLEVERTAPTYLVFRWAPPATVNGVLVGYTLAYRVVDADDITGLTEIEIEDPRMRTLKLKGLDPRTPYHVQMWARTRKGKGVASTLRVQTLPSEPPGAPILQSMAVNKRAVNISWTPARSANPGALFSVHYRRLGQLHWLQKPAEYSRRWTVIGGLVEGVVYEVRVVARNSEEPGAAETSSPVRQVRLGSRREKEVPGFQLQYLGPSSFKVMLSSDSHSVNSYHVKYRQTGRGLWLVTDSAPKGAWVTIQKLHTGRPYQIQLVFRGDGGEFLSAIKEVVAGTNPNAQASRGQPGSTPLPRGSAGRARVSAALWPVVSLIYWRRRS